MAHQIRFREVALRDIDAITDYLEKIDPDLADRFEASVQEVAALALKYPGLGRTLEALPPSLREARFLIPRGFRNYVVYYLPVATGIDVLRIVHGARDLEQMG